MNASGCNAAGELCGIFQHLYFSLDVSSFRLDGGFVAAKAGWGVEGLSKVALAHLKLLWSTIM